MRPEGNLDDPVSLIASKMHGRGWTLVTVEWVKVGDERDGDDDDGGRGAERQCCLAGGFGLGGWCVQAGLLRRGAPVEQ